MWKLIFGAIITIFVVGGVFFVGYVVGTAVTPLDCESIAGAVVNMEVLHVAI